MTGLDLIFTLIGAGWATWVVMSALFRLDEGGRRNGFEGKAR